MSTRPMMHYGKKDVFVYRTYAQPLKVNKQIPESDFEERLNTLIGMDIQVALHGKAFLKNFTDADNTDLITTDTMRIFIEEHAGKIEYSTIDGFLTEVAKRFLKQYPQIDQIDLAGQSVNFGDVRVSRDGEMKNSGVVFRTIMTERPRANVSVMRHGDGAKIVYFSSGIQDVDLMKITGSSFQGFYQDEYTQLPEVKDRNLFINVDIDWTYLDDKDGASLNTTNYVPAEQVRDIAVTILDDLLDQSIQDLVYNIGLRILERFPQLHDVSFSATNKSPSELKDVKAKNGKVYTPPVPAYGFQAFTVTRDDLEYDDY